VTRTGRTGVSRNNCSARTFYEYRDDKGAKRFYDVVDVPFVEVPEDSERPGIVKLAQTFVG